MTQLCLILGDQLSWSLTSLQAISREHDHILMCEVMEEASYVPHHPKKIALLFSAMRHFANELIAHGYTVHYVRLDTPNNSGTLFGEVKRHLAVSHATRIVVTEPGEYRLLTSMQAWEQTLGIPVDIKDDLRFLCSRTSFQQWAQGRKQLRMEFFYREMRRRHNILMAGNQPIGDRWNFDAENRQTPPPDLTFPAPTQFIPDTITGEVLDLVEARFGHHFGTLRPFDYAVTREQAQQVLREFITQRLIKFGDYQDAMLTNNPWMFHAHISFYLNCGLLEPLECIHAAEAAYQQRLAPINAVEGFIRQILGWREYVRGVYWQWMPAYQDLNFLNAQAPLPDFYWNADTLMNCLKQCVLDTQAHAYAHHIQRLMVLGNFALLIGVKPQALNEWYLSVYADAYEWVELPNVSGMVLFADGGYLASKPYIASGQYIHKMSNYCEQCHYNVKEKEGEQACPFNYLYWHFLAQHEHQLRDNPRLAMAYKTYTAMDERKKIRIHQESQRFLNTLRSTQE